MGGKVAMLLATSHPELVDNCGWYWTKFYPQHHQDIWRDWMLIDFNTTQPKRCWTIMTKFVPDFGTRQFLMKNLFWKTFWIGFSI
jgi:hypothetical protein